MKVLGFYGLMVVFLVSSFLMTYRLFKLFPFGSNSKFWWLKYLPFLGVGVFFIAMEGTPIIALAGLFIAAGAGIAGEFLEPRTKVEV